MSRSSKKLEIFRRYGFFRSKWQLQTDVGYPNHPKTWNLSTLRVFQVKMTIADWCWISKSSKTLEIFRRYGYFEWKCQLQTDVIWVDHQRNFKSFDVTGFSSPNVNCRLMLDIQIIQKTSNLSTLRVFQVKMTIADWCWRSKSSNKTWNLSTLRVFQWKVSIAHLC